MSYDSCIYGRTSSVSVVLLVGYVKQLVLAEVIGSGTIEYGIFGKGLKFQPIRSEETVVSCF